MRSKKTPKIPELSKEPPVELGAAGGAGVPEEVLELQKQVEFYRSIVQTAQEGIWRINAASLTDYVNPKMAQMMGYEAEEMLGRPIGDFLDDEGRAMLANLIKRRKGGISEQFEFKYIRKDGSELWAFVSTNPITNADGVYVGAVALLTDIGARKSAEAAWRESEERFRLLFENAGDGILILEGNHFIDCNVRSLEIFGCKSRDQIVGHPPYEFSPHRQPNGRESIEFAIEKITTALKGRPQLFEWVHTKLDGTPFSAEVTLNKVEFSGKVLLQAIVRDISERKKSEEAIRKSEEEFRAVFEQAAVGVAIIDSTTGRYLSVNQRLCEITSRSQKQILAATYMDITLPEDRQNDEINMRKLRGGIVRTFKMEKRYVHPNGDIRWAHVTVSPMWRPGEKPSRHIAIVEDITARKQVELTLAHTADLLERTGEMAKIGGWELDLKSQKLFWSMETCRLFELDVPVAPNLKAAINFYAPEERPKIQAAVEAAIKKGKSYELELRVITAKGKSIWAMSQGSAVKENGKVVRLVGTFQDITERKEAEQQYLREIKFNETLVDHTAVIIVLLDRQGHMVHVNQATVDILGYTRKELLNRTPWEVGIMSTEEKNRALERLQVLLRGGTNPPRETILTAKGGRDHLFSLSSVSTRLPDGTIDRIIVTGADLTERNQLQKEILKISEQEQARIGHNLHDGVGQTMTGVSSLMESLEAELTGDLRVRVARIRQLVQDAIQEVRSMSHSMSPAAVKNRGLGGALQLLAETIRTNHRTSCDCEIDPHICVDDPEKVTHIYRIAQEAANNALRHGKPKNITIRLNSAGPQECVLKIENNGAGIIKKNGGEGIGIRVMEYRANLIRGTLKVESKKRGGVSVVCRFPCSDPPSQSVK
jgi:PAS domain S-box-containing protein